MRFNWVPYAVEYLNSNTEACDIPRTVNRAKEIAKEIFGNENVELHTSFDFIDLPLLLKESNDYLPYTYEGERSIEVLKKRLEELGYTRLSLLIRIPQREIKNETNGSTVIRNLFVWVSLYENGGIRTFRYLKTDYSRTQYIKGYIHSHCPRLDKRIPYEWKSVCTGTGPIGATMRRCANEPSDINLKCFFMELNKIIEIESLMGGPYIRLSELNTLKKVNTVKAVKLNKAQTSIFNAFIKSYVKSSAFQLTFNGTHWCIPKDFLSWLRDLTDYYIKWANLAIQENKLEKSRILLLTRWVLVTIKTQDNAIISDIELNENNWKRAFDATKDIVLVKFNNKEYKLNITDMNTESVKEERLFRPEFAITLLNSLLQTVNYCYEKEEREQYKQNNGEANFNYELETFRSTAIYNKNARIFI